MFRTFAFTLALAAVFVSPMSVAAPDDSLIKFQNEIFIPRPVAPDRTVSVADLAWSGSYAEAYQSAKVKRARLLLVFENPASPQWFNAEIKLSALKRYRSLAAFPVTEHTVIDLFPKLKRSAGLVILNFEIAPNGIIESITPFSAFPVDAAGKADPSSVEDWLRNPGDPLKLPGAKIEKEILSTLSKRFPFDATKTKLRWSKNVENIARTAGGVDRARQQMEQWQYLGFAAEGRGTLEQAVEEAANLASPHWLRPPFRDDTISIGAVDRGGRWLLVFVSGSVP